MRGLYRTRSRTSKKQEDPTSGLSTRFRISTYGPSFPDGQHRWTFSHVKSVPSTLVTVDLHTGCVWQGRQESIAYARQRGPLGYLPPAGYEEAFYSRGEVPALDVVLN